MEPVFAPPAAQALGPQAALRRSAARELALAGAGLALFAALLATAGGLGLDVLAKALAAYALGAALVWRGLAWRDAQGPAHPHPRFGPANRVTLWRLGGLCAVAALLGEPVPAAPPAAAALAAWALVAGATVTAVLDALDGALARRSGLASRFGARFDMETDAAFTLVLAALVWQAGQAGAWVLASGLMRYAFVAAALALPWLAAPLPPRRRRQTVCVVQITALIVCLAPIVPAGLAHAIAALSLLLLGASFAIDIAHLARHRPPRLETAP